MLGGGGGGASSTPQAGSVEAAKAAYTALFGTGDDALLDEDLMARIKLERFALVRIQYVAEEWGAERSRGCVQCEKKNRQPLDSKC